jgi:uncharacterized protein YbjT (DUF2867 family)
MRTAMPGTFPHKARGIQPMKVGVSGASGQLGSATLRHLREGLPVAQLVGVSRTPDSLSEFAAAAFTAARS